MFTKGADPEVFLVDRAAKKFISSVGLIGGSKDFPMPIDEGCSVQEDNVAVEFNIPPCKTADDYVKYINYSLSTIRQRAAEMGLEIAIQPSAVFDDDQLDTEAARTFGCEPDYNAWKEGRVNPRPTATNQNLRSAGGHIHLEVPADMDILEVVKAMDWFVGCQMLRFDNDAQRRELYGKAGAFRKKPYGVEYRTASNRWIEDDDKIRWVWDQSEKALEFVKSGGKFSEEHGKMIQKCINQSSLEILEELSKELPL